MAVEAELKLYLDHVKVVVQGATQKALEAIAFQLEAQTKVQIRDNDQIDTGFMMNSVFTVTPNGKHGSTWGDGEYRSHDTGQMVERRSGSEPGVGEGAAVAVGAEYAIYQEANNSFLFRAAEMVAKEAGGIAERIYRENVHD